jgi:hypothetical protein
MTIPLLREIVVLTTDRFTTGALEQMKDFWQKGALQVTGALGTRHSGQGKTDS